jgi:hypothetical protein
MRMKNVALLFFFTLFAQLSFSQSRVWSFFSEDGEAFFLYINNKLQNRVPVNSIQVDGLILKNYMVKVEFKDITLRDVEVELRSKREGETVWTIYKESMNYEIDLYEKVKKGMYTKPEPLPQIADYQDYKGKVGCPQPIKDDKVEEMLHGFGEFSMSDQRMETMRTFIKNNCVTVDQLKKMMSTLDFEDNKLVVAKFAYSYIFDRNNYYLLHSLFDYPYSVEDLNNYLDK